MVAVVTEASSDGVLIIWIMTHDRRLQSHQGVLEDPTGLRTLEPRRLLSFMEMEVLLFLLLLPHWLLSTLS